MPNFMNFALNMIRNNPNLSSNPRAQRIISAIQNQDMNAAQEIANEICKENNWSVNQAQQMTQQGMQQFPGRF